MFGAFPDDFSEMPGGRLRVSAKQKPSDTDPEGGPTVWIASNMHMSASTDTAEAPPASTKEIQLCGFAKGVDKPSGSGFCQKLETFFRASDIHYQHVETTQFSAPKGKLPYVVFGDGTTLGDSHLIIRHLIATKQAADLNAGLTPVQQADTHAYQAWIEEKLYLCVLWERWHDNAGMAEEEMEGVPWLIRRLLAMWVGRRVLSALYSAGIGRHTREEIHSIAVEVVTGLAAKWSDGRQWFHSTARPTEIDCIVYGFLANALNLRSNPHFNSLVLARPRLVQFMIQATKMWFPEYKSLLEQLNEGQ